MSCEIGVEHNGPIIVVTRGLGAWFGGRNLRAGMAAHGLRGCAERVPVGQ